MIFKVKEPSIRNKVHLKKPFLLYKETNSSRELIQRWPMVGFASKMIKKKIKDCFVIGYSTSEIETQIFIIYLKYHSLDY